MRSALPVISAAITSLTIASLTIGCDVGFDDIERSPYGMSVVFGDNLAELAEVVGPLVVVSLFESRPETGDGAWLFSDGSVGELCFDDGELWVRNVDVHMTPDTPEIYNANAGTSSGWVAGPWRIWDETDKQARTSEVDLRLDQGAPCSLRYTLGLAIIPISDPFRHPDAVEPDPFFCKQTDVYSVGSHVAIAQVPPVAFNDGCANTLVGEDRRTEVDTDDDLVDLPENYPPGSPRPAWVPAPTDGGVTDGG